MFNILNRFVWSEVRLCVKIVRSIPSFNIMTIACKMKMKCFKVGFRLCRSFSGRYFSHSSSPTSDEPENSLKKTISSSTRLRFVDSPRLSKLSWALFSELSWTLLVFDPSSFGCTDIEEIIIVSLRSSRLPNPLSEPRPPRNGPNSELRSFPLPSSELRPLFAKLDFGFVLAI